MLSRGRRLIVVRFKAQELYAVVMFPTINTRDEVKREKQRQTERILKVKNIYNIQFLGFSCF